MSEPDDLEPRVRKLEGRVDRLDSETRSARQDGRAARHLAAATDRDIADLRGEMRDFRAATVGALTALRRDHVELRAEMHAGFAAVDGKLAAVDGKLDGTGVGLAQLTVMLTTLIERGA